MAEPLKYIFNEAFFADLTRRLEELLPAFKRSIFLQEIHDEEWEDRELKQRMRHISTTLAGHLPEDYPSAVEALVELSDKLRGEQSDMNFGYMFLPDFIEVYGLDHYEESIAAMERITQFTSCEFAVRPFIIRYPEKMLARMQAWSEHEDYRVRRFASEGCRPRLPWAMALPALKKDPAPILPILEQLKDDPAEFVRRSVANNLNDISKDHPELTIRLAKSWLGQSPETDWVVKHACRTLLKQGLPEVMELFGFAAPDQIELSDFQVLSPQVRVGEELRFAFQLHNTGPNDALIRLEYAIYYLRANGTHSRKVFKISENTYTAGSSTSIERKQSFRPITTRKFYPGEQFVALVINGREVAKAEFGLEG